MGNVREEIEKRKMREREKWKETVVDSLKTNR